MLHSTRSTHILTTSPVFKVVVSSARGEKWPTTLHVSATGQARSQPRTFTQAAFSTHYLRPRNLTASSNLLLAPCCWASLVRRHASGECHALLNLHATLLGVKDSRTLPAHVRGGQRGGEVKTGAMGCKDLCCGALDRAAPLPPRTC
jgi:hypothetical protein